MPFYPLGVLPPLPWFSPPLLILLQCFCLFLELSEWSSPHSEHHMCGFLSFVWLVEKLTSAFFIELSFPQG